MDFFKSFFLQYATYAYIDVKPIKTFTDDWYKQKDETNDITVNTDQIHLLSLFNANGSDDKIMARSINAPSNLNNRFEIKKVLDKNTIGIMYLKLPSSSHKFSTIL